MDLKHYTNYCSELENSLRWYQKMLGLLKENEWLDMICDVSMFALVDCLHWKLMHKQSYWNLLEHFMKCTSFIDAFVHWMQVTGDVQGWLC